jgi:hypothetical protein
MFPFIWSLKGLMSSVLDNAETVCLSLICFEDYCCNLAIPWAVSAVWNFESNQSDLVGCRQTLYGQIGVERSVDKIICHLSTERPGLVMSFG